MLVKEELVPEHSEVRIKMAEGDFKPELIWGLGKQEAWQAPRSAVERRRWRPAVAHAAACPPLIVLCMDPLTFCPGLLLSPDTTHRGCEGPDCATALDSPRLKRDCDSPHTSACAPLPCALISCKYQQSAAPR
ncbi:unnamed protein product [Pleuronectes platessa]|uniref:Uncharacterized protein n=1 Tax=Pleuronectes platessa TaxID=8262 RepID=A0A9N7W3M0_PLEPL|nr:unnamed protein product [Pleuronectes platessa]